MSLSATKQQLAGTFHEQTIILTLPPYVAAIIAILLLQLPTSVLLNVSRTPAWGGGYVVRVGVGECRTCWWDSMGREAWVHWAVKAT